MGRLAQQASESAQERCEFCSEPIGREHRHLFEVDARQIVCVCRACSILFDRDLASNGRYRLVPDRRLALTDFQLTDAQWESLYIPVGIAYLTFSTAAGRVLAFYPGPMGQMQSLLGPETWNELVQRNPVLGGLRPDVEALLVNRARGARQYFLVPIDDCYSLVGLIRTRWRGLGGGSEVWTEIGRFFDELGRRARPAPAAGIVVGSGPDHS